MVASGTLTRETSPRTTSSAAVWVNGRIATIARTQEEGIWTTRVTRGIESEAAFLDRVIHAIGDCERVLILGPGTARLALEREYVTIYHRPDRLVDVEPSDAIPDDLLVARVRELAG